MPGYMNPDGSELVGGQLPSGAGQALQLDAQGNLKTTATLNAASNQRVNAQAGDFQDGAIATMGAKSDSAWDLASTSPSEIAILKKVALLMNAIDTGIPVTNFPSNQRVNAQSGDIADGAIVTLGQESDAAWNLSGNATVIALLKKLDLLLQYLGYDNTNELKTSLYGKSNGGAAGDTPLLLDAQGRPLINLSQLNGNTPQLDGAGSNRLGVSLYGGQSAAGDTYIAADSSNRLKVNATVANGSGSVTNANPLQVNLYPGGAVQSASNPSFVKLTDGTNTAAISAAIANALLSDMGDRWARQVGQIDIARVLGAALSANNPVHANIAQIGGVATQMSNSDGVSQANIAEHGLAATAAGGPVLASGLPSLLNIDRLRTIEGKAVTSVSITSTTAGDTQLNCSAGALKLVSPGQKIQLSGGGPIEDVLVSTSYVPSTSATSIPLQSPVVNTGQTSAKFDTFSSSGPGAGGSMLADGLLPVVLVAHDQNNNGNFYLAGIASADAMGTTRFLETVPGLYNNSSYDRQRGNLDNITYFNVSNVSSTQTTSDQINYNHRGIKVYLYVTTIGSGSLVLTIFGKDQVSGQTYTLLASSAVTTNGLTVLTIYPGLTSAANSIANDVLPRTYRIQVTGASSSTFIVSGSLLL
jgi:hypothetical protein